MSSQTQVRELFSLPKKEVIFDDFGCAYSKGLLYQGRMYLTENYICFFSSIMGITKKLIIPMTDVQKVTKARSLGLIKSIKIYQAGKKSSYRFQSFTDYERTYKIIYKLWSNVSPNVASNQGGDKSSEEDTGEGAEEDTLRNSRNSMITERAIIREMTVSEAQSSNPLRDDLNSQVGANNGTDPRFAKTMIVATSPKNLQQQSASPSANSAQQALAKGDSGFSQQLQAREELKIDPDFSMVLVELDKTKNSFNQNIPAEPVSKEMENQVKDQKKAANPANDNSSGLEKQNSHILVEKAQGLNEIIKSHTSTAAGDNVTKDELDHLLDVYPVPENHEEISRYHLSFPARDFFTLVAKHSGQHSFERFYQERGEQKIESQPWQKPEPPEEYDGRPVIQSSQMYVEVQIKDNPFLKVSPTTKYFKMIEQSDTQVHIKVLSKCQGVPYCETFAVEEDWLALSPSAAAGCCIVRVMSQAIFYKSTIFRSKIQGGIIKGQKQIWEEFGEWLKKRGLQFKEKKQQALGGKLKHGLEKSNKLFERQKSIKALQQKEAKTFSARVTGLLRQSRNLLVQHRLELLLFIILFLQIHIIFRLQTLELAAANSGIIAK